MRQAFLAVPKDPGTPGDVESGFAFDGMNHNVRAPGQAGHPIPLAWKA